MPSLPVPRIIVPLTVGKRSVIDAFIADDSFAPAKVRAKKTRGKLTKCKNKRTEHGKEVAVQNTSLYRRKIRVNDKHMVCLIT